MALEEIDVFIDKSGQVRIEVRGIAGKSCLETTAGLEAALGGQVVEREMTHEAAQEPLGDDVRQRRQQGT